MISYFNQIIGRSYTPLQDSGHAISTVAGLDFEWIASAILIIICVYLFVKTFYRIFIGK